MDFIRFLEKVPERNKNYLGRIKRCDSCRNVVFVYWGKCGERYDIQDQHGAFLDPQDLFYIENE